MPDHRIAQRRTERCVGSHTTRAFRKGDPPGQKRRGPGLLFANSMQPRASNPPPLTKRDPRLLAELSPCYDFRMQPLKVARDLLSHAAWADAEVWIAVRAPPEALTDAKLKEKLHQVSTYHRGQANSRLRELGGKPPLVDYIAWIWFGRPAPRWDLLRD